METNDTYAHWRDSARTPRFFVIDARASFALVLLVFIHNRWTFSIALLWIALLTFLNYRGLTVTAAFRILRGWLSGPKKLLIRH